MRILVMAAALALAACAGGDRATRPKLHYGAGPGDKPFAGAHGRHAGNAYCCGAPSFRGSAGFWAGRGMAAPPSGSGAGFWTSRGVAAPSR